MMNRVMNKQMKTQRGFTLVEMAIAMVIVGFILAFATVGFSRALVMNAERNTFKNMEYVADALSIYAQKHMRMPCPADPEGLTGATTNGEPFGTEINSTASGDVFGECDVSEAEGIIPFATLGLPKRMAKDKFGNYLTYRVSVSAALKPEVTIALPINNWCMTRPYWNTDTDNANVTNEYVSLAKAAFCCGTWDTASATGVDGDIDIQGSFGPLEHLSRLDPNGGAGGDRDEYRLASENPPSYAALENPGITGFVGGSDSTVPPSFPAYILVSHGQNGNGAFSEENGARDTTGITDPELENIDDNVTFYAPDRLASTAPGGGLPSLFSNDIDDIVLWATPFTSSRPNRRRIMQRAINNTTQKINRSAQEGFILIELAVVFLILGLMLAAALPVYETFKHRNGKADTQKRMEIVSKAFSSYAQTRWRLPCPADASVAAGNPIGVERASCDVDEVDAHGIIPYKTLGISERYAKDGYGNFFTYVVSPDFTADNRLGVQLDRVNSRLANRVAGSDARGKYALLPRAQFCAPLNNTGDIVVQQDGTDLYARNPRENVNINRPTAGTPNTNINRENIVTGLAMAIISHGENGDGAYLSNGNQSPPNPDNTSAEAITSDNENRIVVTESIYSTIGAAAQYDDIVNFFTQDEIFSLSGHQSCENL